MTEEFCISTNTSLEKYFKNKLTLLLHFIFIYILYLFVYILRYWFYKDQI